MKNKSYSIISLAMVLFSCHDKTTEAVANPDPVLPVTVTRIDTSAIENFTELNATTTYLIKNTIRSNATGYLDRVNVISNEFVHKGKLLFTLKTREAKVLGNTINKIDPTLNFGNAIPVKATADGYLGMVNVQQGDYVQEGDALTVINEAKSFSIVMSLPYELKKHVYQNQVLNAYLPDGMLIKTRVDQFMPTVDPASQTQNVILKCIHNENIPENLIVKMKINTSPNTSTVSLPKAAVLSDETETNFWIMKMINSNTAVKFKVKKGIETENRIEILSPKLTLEDQILLTGNYGVGDTIKVKISK